MSLIEQALRRVQDPVLKTTTQTPGATQQAAAPEPKAHSWATQAPPAPLTATGAAPRVTNALVAVALAVLGLTAVLVVGGAFWMGHTVSAPQSALQSAKTENAAPAGAKQPASSSQASAPARRPAPTEQPEFVLSGVVEGVGDPYAVINGAIVAIGDQVGRATLVAISGSVVTLRLADGEQVILRVAR